MHIQMLQAFFFLLFALCAFFASFKMQWNVLFDERIVARQLVVVILRVFF